VVSANPTAAGLLGIDPRDAHEYHFTDFVNPGALDDSVALFDSILEGRPLDATILLRPISGDVLAVDLHAVRRGGDIVGVMRFADDLDMAVEPLSQVPAVTLVTSPATDVAFRVFALRAMGRMPEPTPDGLALRLHRVYPHATVHPDGGTWTAAREPSIDGQASDDWWREPGLARVRCDARALILEANDAACELFGRDLVGHHWQEFAVPGSSDAVTVMLDILREAGAAETRFRLPRADGTLLEFDSYTTVTGGDFATIMRPVETPESDASRRREKQPPPTDREVRSQTGA
jgi:PAS domain-containing protein